MAGEEEPRIVPFSRAPGAQGNVRRGLGDVLVENVPFSRIFHAAVLNASGEFLYDLPTVAEPAGAIALAIDRELRVGLLKQWRAVPSREPGDEDALNFGAGDALPPRGFWSIEVPRGYPKVGESAESAACREAEEELSVRVTQSVYLGHCNFNTSIMLSDIPMYGVLAHPEVRSERRPDEAERIEHVTWYAIEDVLALVSQGGIRCGLTLAALLHVVASRSKLEELIKIGTS